MNPPFLKRNGALLTDNEKSMIINVAEVLGVSEGTIGSVVADWNSRGDNTFIPHKVLGRPTLEPDENISELLRMKILNANKMGEHLSTPILRQYLSEQGLTISKWKLLWILHRLGYYFDQGERRNILHESPNNVAFRCHYLHFCFANLEGKNDVPRLPEVFLDESYCHLHHTSRNTWVPHQGVVLSPGHGPLVVIFGAIIVQSSPSIITPFGTTKHCDYSEVFL
ncbi:hypothetical protein C1645_825824 [Glomus cerebriforme]|uniref:Uncharacterized protein n=1 Tax=Glomus cerebriforme TaxID=658196 RepID=A0A397T0W1_9GLOM|nr:hypothetical protein C1645_825824 [Glomus cerebriforme]